MQKLHHPKIPQKIPDDIYLSKAKSIVHCYEHFSEKYDERWNDSYLGPLNYNTYWDNWIKYMRGYYLSEKGDRMERVIGHYINDPTMYKIVYVKLPKIGIYVPLTIFEIKDIKTKLHLYKIILKNKSK